MGSIQRESVPELLNGLPIAVVAVDMEGHIVFVSQQAERLFGYAHEQLLGEPMELLVPNRLRVGHRALRLGFNSVPDARPMGEGRDLFARRRDGTEFPVEIGLNPIHTHNGTVVFAVVIDLSERKRSEAELKAANEALLASNLELQQFAYVASHDLQEPVRRIQLLASLLLEEHREEIAEQGREYVDQIAATTDQMYSLIQDLLSIARVESRAKPMISVDLNELLDSTLNTMKTSIDDAGASISKDPLPQVLGDTLQIAQLFSNLVGNSLKYAGAKAPRIHVSCSRNGKFWTISVADNGVGIAPQHFGMIFEIFRRLHASADIPGTGIGLALCRRIVNRHGGEIWVDSTPGEGSVFSFTLLDASDNNPAATTEITS